MIIYANITIILNSFMMIPTYKMLIGSEPSCCSNILELLVSIGVLLPLMKSEAPYNLKDVFFILDILYYNVNEKVRELYF